jgi:hypothetical protein
VLFFGSSQGFQRLCVHPLVGLGFAFQQTYF